MKWFGEIGFLTYERDPDNPTGWLPKMVKETYYGDVLKVYKSDKEISNQIADDITINNRISIIADPFAMNNFHQIKYIEFMGAKWKVTSVDVRYPRLDIYMGSVYKEEEEEINGSS